MKSRPEDIKAFWDQRADTFGTDGKATLPERAMHALEIQAIQQHLGDGLRVADIGCGNGFATLRFASQFRSNFVGVDYSERMIHYGRQALASLTPNALKGEVEFGVGSVLDLPLESNSFDRVITERCLQNLLAWEFQAQGIGEVARVLKPGGVGIMVECSQTGVDDMNRWRKLVGRPVIDDAVPWHNLFFRDDMILSLKGSLPIAEMKIEHFSSSYTFLTRVLPFWRLLYYQENLATHIPNIGTFGYFKLYLIRKAA